MTDSTLATAARCSLTDCRKPKAALVRWPWSSRKFGVCDDHLTELRQRDITVIENV